MKTAVLLLPLLCAFATAAPACGSNLRRRDAGSSVGDTLSSLGLRAPQDVNGCGGSILGDVGPPRRANFIRSSDNDDNSDGDGDSTLADAIDGSQLKVDSNGQDVDVADLSSLLPLRRRALVPLPSGSGNGDDKEQVANVLDGSTAGISQNAQNISVAELKRRKLLSGLGGGEGENDAQDVDDDDGGNGSDDDSLLNLLDGDTVDIDHNLQNVTILRARRQGSGNGDADDNKSLANVLDGDAVAVDQNGQDITLLRRREAYHLLARIPSAVVRSAAATAAAIPTAAPSTSSVAKRARPVVDTGDNDNSKADDNDNDDAILNVADNSEADISKNLQNITVLKRGDGDVDGNDDGTVANVLDGSALGVTQNVQDIDVA